MLQFDPLRVKKVRHFEDLNSKLLEDLLDIPETFIEDYN